MKTVFLFLAVRAYISDILNTPYIKYLSQCYKVVVFLREMEGIKDPDKEYYKNENITYIVAKEPQSRFWMLFGAYLRNEFIRMFDDNPAVKWRNESPKKDSRRKFLRKISNFLPKKLFKPGFFFFLEKLFFLGYKQFKKFADKYNPVLVLTAAPGLHPFDTYAILCAKKAGIPSVAMNMGLDNLTVYPRHIRPVDYLIVWNKMNKEQAIKWHGYNKNNVFVSGAMRFDHYFIPSKKEKSREEFLQSKGLDSKAKTVLYAAKTYGMFYKNFINNFIQWQKENVFGEPVNLFVRVHPLDSLSDFEEFFNVAGVHIERAAADLKQDDKEKGHKVEMNEDDLINLKDTLKYCDVCVTITSTMVVELFLFDKPVVTSAVPDGRTAGLKFLHNQPYFENKALRVAHTYEEIKKYLAEYLKSPELDCEGRKKVVEYMAGPSDGLAYKRNVDFLDTILKNKNKN